MPIFQRILVPTDFSELSAHAAGYARKVAETHGAEVHVVHVVVPVALTGAVPAGPLASELVLSNPPIDALLDGARESVASFIRDHLGRLTVKSDVMVGVAHSQICQYAGDNACDLIVIGSHARGIVHRVFLGSVSKAVLEHSPCPLLMVPLKAADAPAT